MVRPSGFLTNYGAAELLLDRRRTLGAAARMQNSRRPRWQNGQNRGNRTWEAGSGWLGAPDGRTAAVAEIGAFGGLARAAAVAESAR
jgi:hypothetical protein